MKNKNIEIVSYKPEYSADFASLNLEWLAKFFIVERYDKEVLSNPENYIINKGGHIFFALLDNKVVGTVALIQEKEGVFELSKMAVTPKCQGLRIGQKLMYACIDYAGRAAYSKLILYSSKTLVPALTLYKKVGFKDVPVPADSPYIRCNVMMELHL